MFDWMSRDYSEDSYAVYDDVPSPVLCKFSSIVATLKGSMIVALPLLKQHPEQ